MSLRALVIGGTGPTGPGVVNGLLDRRYSVAILHSGRHEGTFSGPVEHIHADPHFPETLVDALGRRSFDLTVAMYGRLRHTAQVMKGRTDRFVCVSGAAGYAARGDPAWGRLGQTLLADENGPWELDPERSSFHFQLHASEDTVLEAHAAGHYRATILRPPNMYGPRQLGPEEWAVVRRILDGRRRMVIADGGLKIDAKIYTLNFIQAMLLVVDSPSKASGERYNVRDETVFTLRQRIELVAKVMGVEFELIDMPWELARPSHPYWRLAPTHVLVSDRKIRSELGHRDAVAAGDAVEATVKWLLEHKPTLGGEEESQLGDPFNYSAEDALIETWAEAKARVAEVEYPLPPPAHRYRHPKTPNEEWARPTGKSGYKPGQ